MSNNKKEKKKEKTKQIPAKTQHVDARRNEENPNQG